MALTHDVRVARAFFDAVAEFSRSVKPWSGGVVYYETKPDEVYDLTLVSRRVYGNSYEYLAVMACAGLSHVDDALPVGIRLAMPNEMMIMRLKRDTGFESNPEMIESGRPMWYYGNGDAV
jgi:hypothetical protein